MELSTLLRSLMIAMACMFVAAASAQAQQTPTRPSTQPSRPGQAPIPAAVRDNQVFDDWIASCGKIEGRATERCVIAQARVNAQSQRVVRSIAGYIGANGEPFLVFDLPLGVYLPAGAALRIDEGAQRPMVFDSCTVEGCRTGIALDVPLLQSLRMGNVARIGFLSKAGGETITVDVSLKGFNAGFALLKP